jgi:hydrogenase maturation protease
MQPIQPDRPLTRGRPERRGLVVGIGNLLRSDDRVGFAAVERLGADPRLADAGAAGRLRLVWAQQLTPELAIDFTAVDVVVLVDADAELAPGSISSRRVAAAPSQGGSASLTHHVDPGTLAAMATDLYGGAPEVFVVGVGPGSLDVGESLTPTVEAAVPAVVETVIQLLGAGFEG